MLLSEWHHVSWVTAGTISTRDLVETIFRNWVGQQVSRRRIEETHVLACGIVHCADVSRAATTEVNASFDIRHACYLIENELCQYYILPGLGVLLVRPAIVLVYDFNHCATVQFGNVSKLTTFLAFRLGY
ncbi:hypothetical protein D3C71_1703480 [compost metagenome]